MKAPSVTAPTAPYRLLLAAGFLALVVTALLSRVVWRLAQTGLAVAAARAGCDCCTEVAP
jgi:hypothetical protein